MGTIWALRQIPSSISHFPVVGIPTLHNFFRYGKTTDSSHLSNPSSHNEGFVTLQRKVFRGCRIFHSILRFSQCCGLFRLPSPDLENLRKQVGFPDAIHGKSLYPVGFIVVALFIFSNNWERNFHVRFRLFGRRRIFVHSKKLFKGPSTLRMGAWMFSVCTKHVVTIINTKLIHQSYV